QGVPPGVRPPVRLARPADGGQRFSLGVERGRYTAALGQDHEHHARHSTPYIEGRTVKVQSGSAVMFHYLPGQHRHVAEWHNEIHRPEIHGAVPHVFYSQDFVAPPAYVAARQHADLPMAGGEYLSLYWSEGSLEQLGEDNRTASQDRRNA